MDRTLTWTPTAKGAPYRSWSIPFIARFPLPARVAFYAAIAFLALANLVMVTVHFGLFVAGSDATDWWTYKTAVQDYGTGTIYEPGPWWYGWRYSPVSIPLFAVVALIGELAWRLLHFVALLGLPRRWAMLALLSYPFWFDVTAGNLLIFLVVLTRYALLGNRWATAVLLVVALLIPRPMMVPLVVWILWQRPEWRWPFVGLFVLHAIGVLLTGYGDEWIGRLTQVSGEELVNGLNAAPSALIGGWWMLVAVPLAAWAFWRGRPALSGLLLQPYWLPYYLLMPLADAPRPQSLP